MTTTTARKAATGQGRDASTIGRIHIEFIPEEEQRYATLGDWRYEGDTLQIKASGPNEVEAFLVALHELVEAMLCRQAGICQARVDAFDLAFTGDGEPGDDPRAPYRDQHRKAMLIEHLMANFLGLTAYGDIR